MPADPVDFLTGLVQRYSPSGSERDVAEYARDHFAAAGVSSFIDGAGNVCAEIGDGDPPLVLLGHIDTVDGDFGVRVEGGSVHGRGAVDAKGPFAAFASAVIRLAAIPGRRVVAIGAVEEETVGSRGARFVLDRYRPGCVVIGEPSGWTGLTLGYKGRIAIEYRSVSVPQHGAAPGPPPLQRAIDYWNALCAYRDAFNSEKTMFYQLDLNIQDVRQDAAPERVTVDLVGHARLPVGLDVRELESTAVAAGAGATVSVVDDAPPILASKATPLVRAFLRAIRRHGGEPKFKVKSGTSDMNTVGPVWNVPILAYGPGDSSLDHTPHEHVEIDEYLRSIDVLTAAIAELSDRVQAGEA
jgi:[amino group carrier protein]-lysine/ornithine hydrolase